MAYNEERGMVPIPTARISRRNPTCVLFLLDQSGFMGDPWISNITKAVALSDIINKHLCDLVIMNSFGEKIIDRFYIGVIGYGKKVGPVFKGALSTKKLVPISEIANNPSRIEERTKKIEDGAGELVDQNIKFPIWFDPVAVNGTPMCKAIDIAHDLLEEWLKEHPNCSPPLVINICGSEPTDGDIKIPAEKLKSLESSNGNVLFYNIYLSSKDLKIILPDSDKDLPDIFSKKLFDVSSFLPEEGIDVLKLLGFTEIDLSNKSRCFIINTYDINFIFPLRFY